MGRVRVFAREKLVETPFGILEPRMGHRDARRFQTRGPDRDQERFLGLIPGGEIPKTLLDEIAAGKSLVAHPFNIRLVTRL